MINNTNNTYDNNIKLEKEFAEQVKCILGRVFFKQDFIMDIEQGTDFFTREAIRVGLRLRTYEYFKYRDEFTIRTKAYNNGTLTEIDKIMQGLVDYNLYGFVNEAKNKIIQYFIGDLEIFRDQVVVNPDIREICQKNTDTYATGFKAYKIKDFPANFIIKGYNLPQ